MKSSDTIIPNPEGTTGEELFRRPDETQESSPVERLPESLSAADIARANRRFWSQQDPDATPEI